MKCFLNPNYRTSFTHQKEYEPIDQRSWSCDYNLLLLHPFTNDFLKLDVDLRFGLQYLLGRHLPVTNDVSHRDLVSCLILDKLSLDSSTLSEVLPGLVRMRRVTTVTHGYCMRVDDYCTNTTKRGTRRRVREEEK